MEISDCYLTESCTVTIAFVSLSCVLIVSYISANEIQSLTVSALFQADWCLLVLAHTVTPCRVFYWRRHHRKLMLWEGSASPQLKHE